MGVTASRLDVRRHLHPPYVRRTRKLAVRAAREMASGRRTRQLERVNRESSRPVVGTAPVVVSLTTFGRRIDSVFAPIESIAAG